MNVRNRINSVKKEGLRGLNKESLNIQIIDIEIFSPSIFSCSFNLFLYFSMLSSVFQKLSIFNVELEHFILCMTKYFR